MTRKGMGGHQSAAAKSVVWLTPQPILRALGPFDLDPCAAPDPKPWATAAHHYTLPMNGLILPWFDRVWLNPPYGNETGRWLDKLAEHGCGTALIFARTETEAFHQHVWNRADACLFLAGRLYFHRPDGTPAESNAGAPSVLVAYGADDAERLYESDIEGKFVPLTRPVMIHVALNLDVPMPGWLQVVTDSIEALGGKASLTELYSRIQNHPRTRSNPNWRAKVRQTVARARLPRVAPATYALAS